jgi:hypothetical protein
MHLAIVIFVAICGVWQTSAKPYPEDWSRCRKQYETLRAEVKHLQIIISQLQYAVSKCSKHYIKGKKKMYNSTIENRKMIICFKSMISRN